MVSSQAESPFNVLNSWSASARVCLHRSTTPRLGFALVRELEADAVRVVEVHRPGVAADVDRAEIGQVRFLKILPYLRQALFADRE